VGALNRESSRANGTKFGRPRRSRSDGVALLIDGLLSGGNPEVRRDAHAHMEPLRSDKSSGVRVSPLRWPGAALDRHPKQNVEDA
jgi:hypothetical protein